MKIWWDVLVSIVLLASCFTTPLNLAFPSAESNEQYAIILWVMDGMFLVDIVANFLSAYEDEEFQMIDDRKLIAMSYLKGWFSVDVMAILPLDIILSMGGGDVKGNMNSLLRVARIGKLYKLVKITRLVRLIKVIK